MTTLRVLLVEDSESDAKLVARTLREIGRDLEILRVETPEDMRNALAERAFDLVISDWSMPRFSALAALAVLHETPHDLPFIIVSGTVGDESAVDAMRAGAHDYVLKDNLTRLAPAVERELREHQVRSARRAADEALRLQAARFRALIDRSDEGIALTDAEGRLLFVSAGGKHIFGPGAHELDGDLIGSWVHPDDRARAAESCRRVCTTRAASDVMEFRALRPDGTISWIEATLVNRLDDPSVAAVVGNFRDVTERRLAVEGLEESELRFGRLWESGVFGIVIAEATGRWLEANDAVLETLGYTRADLRDGKLDGPRMTPPEWRETTRTTNRQLVSPGTVQPYEKEYFRKDGSRVPVLVALATLSGTRVISLIMDLSGQRAAERERARAEAALESTEAQLRQAQKMEAIGRLAGGVAHDFNNLLSVIISYGELAMGDLKPDDPMQGDLDEICKAARRAADLTTQLLMFSRQQVLAPTVVNLNEVLGAMDKMLRRVLGEDVDLASVQAEDLGQVKVDRSSIEQVVMNLAVNARDAMPVGGQLIIETRRVLVDEALARARVGLTPGPYVALMVSDTGVGMDEATLSHVFEPFFTTKGIGKGTGLGLSTVFGIVQQSGGTVWVESEMGKGTIFTIHLPEVAALVTRTHAALPPEAARGSETILLVEDDDAVRTVARGILARFGYHVIEARSPGDALLVATEHAGTIDLLLTDVAMPQMSGPVLATRLLESRPDMLVLCMSGYTDDSAIRHGVFSSAIAFLQKPFTPDTLRRKVRQVLDAPAKGRGSVGAP